IRPLCDKLPLHHYLRRFSMATIGGTAKARPDALMVFDGACNFFSGSVRLVSYMDKDGGISFATLPSSLGQELCRQHGVDPHDPTTFLFFDKGQALQATDAIAAMMARLQAPWRWLRLIKVIPRPMRDAMYRWTARNRYRLFGRRKTCMVPSANLRRRFVDLTPAQD